MYLKSIEFCICFIYFVGVHCTNEEKAMVAKEKFDVNETDNTVSAHSNQEQVMEHSQKLIQNPQNDKTDKNILVKNNRKKRIKKKKKKKLLKQNENTELLIETTTFAFDISELKNTKKRRRKKRKRKNKQNQNNIFELTTAKILIDDTSTKNKNATLNNLTELKNRDLEMTFKNTKAIRFKKKKLNQGLVNIHNATKISKRLKRCGVKNGGCSQICKEKGKTKCSCFEGYTLAKNRRKCVDVNECKFQNGFCKEICKNTLGSYYCDCTTGFRISDDLRSCQDINECHLRNGHGPCQDTCTNTYGSYICDCSHLNGTRLGNDKHSCQDINECDEGISGCSHLCINTNVGAFCSCPEGMELMSDYKTCEDIDECEDVSIKNSCTRECVNTLGSYYCEDFQNDQSSNKTKIPVCPPLNPPKYGFISCRRNDSLPYDTFSRSGRKIIKNSPGTKCHLICPTGFRLSGGNRFVCGISGKWVVKKRGLCTSKDNNHFNFSCLNLSWFQKHRIQN